MKLNKKAFTLIELLIVIAIIGILAVSFLPSLFNAPRKARDTERVADLEKLQKVVISATLLGKTYPSDGCIKNVGAGSAAFGPYIAELGGEVPLDPLAPTARNYGGGVSCADGNYYYKKNPSASYKFGVYANVEEKDKANSLCTTARTGVLTIPGENDTLESNWCYAILSQ